MNTEEVLEGNKLIAEFMGAKVYENWTEYLDATYYKMHHPMPTADNPLTETQIKENTVIESTAIWNPRYHTSWDCIMPVVQKIYKTLTPIGQKQSDDERLRSKAVVETLIQAKINFLWQSVVEFIKWYNNQK